MKELLGVKVLDFIHKISGKYCTYTLSQYGAEVLRLENKNFSQKGKQHKNYIDLNSKSKIITIDLEEEKGRASFYEILKTTDIFVTCHSNDLLKKLKIDYETISAINPQVNMIHITGFLM